MGKGYRIFFFDMILSPWRIGFGYWCPFKFHSFACFHSFIDSHCLPDIFLGTMFRAEPDLFLMVVKCTPKKASSKGTFKNKRAQYCHFILSVAFVESGGFLCFSHVLWREQKVSGPLFINSPICFLNLGLHKDI